MGREAEEKEARAWLAANPDVGGSLPSDHYRSNTGETIEQEQSGYLTKGNGAWSRADSVRSTEEHRGLLSYSHLEEIYQAEGHGVHWNILASLGGRTPEQLEIRDQMDRAMALLSEDHQELLRMRFYEEMTLEAMAEELGVRLFAVQKKLAVAGQNLLVAIGETWNQEEDNG